MAEPLISEETTGRILTSSAASISHQLSALMAEHAMLGDVRTVPEVIDVSVRTAFQVGLTLGMRVADADRIGAVSLIAAIERYVHGNDPEAIRQELIVARTILEEIHR